MRNLLSRIFAPRPLVISPVAIRSGDDLVISTPDRLDSDDALRLLNAAKKQFSGVRIHLLTGFGQIQVQRNDSGSQGTCGNDCANPPLPVPTPAVSNPFAAAAQASEQGDVMAITYATGLRLIAVYIPPKQEGDSVEQFHFLPSQLRE